jgi:hypothetical protein
MDPAIKSTREVHAEEGERRVRNWVDHVLNERLTVWHEFVVLAPKRDDAKAGDTSRAAGKDI